MTRFSVGDRVEHPSSGSGTVVGDIGRQEFARHLEAWRWSSLVQGLLVLLDSGVFVHIREPELGVLRRVEHERMAD